MRGLRVAEFGLTHSADYHTTRYPRGLAGEVSHCRPNCISEGDIVSDLKTKFDQAVADSKNLSERPDNQTLLKLYALYKQATTGDVEGKRPGFTDMVGRAKWDAWNEFKGISNNDAMKQYVSLIEDLKG
jgi:diazepam-binding inhibitor (GABA receptor modulating acyl-CoA-binding protein)